MLEEQEMISRGGVRDYKSNQRGLSQNMLRIKLFPFAQLSYICITTVFVSHGAGGRPSVPLFSIYPSATTLVNLVINIQRPSSRTKRQLRHPA